MTANDILYWIISALVFIFFIWTAIQVFRAAGHYTRQVDSAPSRVWLYVAGILLILGAIGPVIARRVLTAFGKGLSAAGSAIALTDPTTQQPQGQQQQQ